MEDAQKRLAAEKLYKGTIDGSFSPPPRRPSRPSRRRGPRDPACPTRRRCSAVRQEVGRSVRAAKQSGGVILPEQQRCVIALPHAAAAAATAATVRYLGRRAGPAPRRIAPHRSRRSSTALGRAFAGLVEASGSLMATDSSRSSRNRMTCPRSTSCLANRGRHIPLRRIGCSAVKGLTLADVYACHERLSAFASYVNSGTMTQQEAKTKSSVRPVHLRGPWRWRAPAAAPSGRDVRAS